MQLFDLLAVVVIPCSLVSEQPQGVVFYEFFVFLREAVIPEMVAAK